MRVRVVPTCNQQLILSGIQNNLRIDGRDRESYRHLEIVFGQKHGSCLVALGNTRILCHINAVLGEPKTTRPSEGTIRISVDLSPMASPAFEGATRNTEECVEIVRVLERSVRDARCLDMESLCIIAGKSAWSLEANLTVINHCGNMIEAASIALLSALSHFKRPEVTVTDEQKLVVHDFDERYPIPLTIFHMPFCTKFCFFKNQTIVDPSDQEEDVAEGSLIVASNAHRELTALHVSGKARIDQHLIKKCTSRAMARTCRVTEYVKSALQADKAKRDKKELGKIGFAEHIRQSGPALLGVKEVFESLTGETADESDEEMDNTVAVEGTKAYRFADLQASDRPEIGLGGPSQWDCDEMDDSEEGEDSDEDDSSSPAKSTSIPPSTAGPSRQSSKKVHSTGGSTKITASGQRKKVNTFTVYDVSDDEDDDDDDDDVVVMETSEFAK